MQLRSTGGVKKSEGEKSYSSLFKSGALGARRKGVAWGGGEGLNGHTDLERRSTSKEVPTKNKIGHPLWWKHRESMRIRENKEEGRERDSKGRKK